MTEQNIHTRVAETLAEKEAFDPLRIYKIEKYVQALGVITGALIMRVILNESVCQTATFNEKERRDIKRLKAFRFKKECEEDAKQDVESHHGLSVSVFFPV